MKITRYRSIPKFTRDGNYAVDMVPDYLLEWIDREQRENGLDLYPDFQRGHVWTEKQQSAFIEYILRGGKSGRDLYFNCPFWQDKKQPGTYQEFVCVDGLQRITAWEHFLNDRIPVFGSLHSEYTDRYPYGLTMRVHVNELKTRKEVLQWYIDMNAGGTPHSEEEIERVRALLREEQGCRKN